MISKNYPFVKCVEFKETHDLYQHLDKDYIWFDLQGSFASFVLFAKYCFKEKSIIRRFTYKKKRWSRYSFLFMNYIIGRKRQHKNREKQNSVARDLTRRTQEILSAHYNLSHSTTVTTDFRPLKKNTQPHEALKELDFGQWITIAPGAKYKPKKLPGDFIANLLSRTFDVSQKKPNLLLVGGKDEFELISSICNKLEGKFHYLNLCGKLTLEQSALAISKTKLTISSDSAMAHISEALGVQTFMIYGPTSIEFGFSLHHNESSSLYSSLGCSPCSRHGKTPCRYKDFACYKNVETKTLESSLRNLD